MDLVLQSSVTRAHMTPDLPEEQLRLLYLDWCSTQVAKRFLELSHDEVWLRSNFAASLPTSGEESGESPVSLPFDRIPGYLDLVRKTAVVLAREMDLPEFVEWKDKYLENPETYDLELLRQK